MLVSLTKSLYCAIPPSSRSELHNRLPKRTTLSHHGQAFKRASRSTHGKRFFSVIAKSDKSLSDVSCKDLAKNVAATLNGTNLYLVGMMGSGKTSVGSILAKKLEYSFLDVDDVIEQAAKCTISELFQTNGEEDLRAIETSALKHLHVYKKFVVATGGGIVIKNENWSYLHQGITLFLNCAPEKLAQRVTKDGIESRPVLALDDTDPDLDLMGRVKLKLRKTYSERLGKYENADITINLDDPNEETGLASVEEVVMRILIQLNARIEEAKTLRETQKNFDIRGVPNKSNEVIPANNTKTTGIGFGDSYNSC